MAVFIALGFCKLFVAALDDLMLKILLVAAIVSMVISMIFEEDHRDIAWIEGFAILMAVFVVSSVTAWNDHKKEEQFLKLNEYSESKNNVMCVRNNDIIQVNFNDIKVGDLVEIKNGMAIPCDGVMIRGTGVTTDESAMTGESTHLPNITPQVLS